MSISIYTGYTEEHHIIISTVVNTLDCMQTINHSLAIFHIRRKTIVASWGYCQESCMTDMVVQIYQ